jgi:hypothetical protein
MQVCIAANKRVLNCKLVQFNPDGLELFLSWHGFEYDSQTSASQDSTRLAEMLKSYVFDGSKKPYSFIRVLKEMRNDDMDEAALAPSHGAQSLPAQPTEKQQ